MYREYNGRLLFSWKKFYGSYIRCSESPALSAFIERLIEVAGTYRKLLGEDSQIRESGSKKGSQRKNRWGGIEQRLPCRLMAGWEVRSE